MNHPIAKVGKVLSLALALVACSHEPQQSFLLMKEASQSKSMVRLLNAVPLNQSYEILKDRSRLDAVANGVGYARFPGLQEQLAYGI